MKHVLPLVVIRPSGIWNSRAPLHNYILEIRDLSKSTCILTLALCALRHDATVAENQARPGRQFLKRITKHEAVASNAWLDYRRCFPRAPDGKHPQPAIGQIASDAIQSLYHIREMSVIRASAIFEAYSQCWALNYLAGKLESGIEFSEKEIELVRLFNPILGKGHLPGWPQIVRGLPFLRDGLSKMPHLFTHPATGEKVLTPLSEEINAYSVIQFWRAFRNLSVHSSRLVTRRFFEKYGEFFSRIVSDLSHLAKLEPGKRMPLHNDSYPHLAAVQYRSALWMNEKLINLTNFRRGHPEAPGIITTAAFDAVPRTPLMFLAGDHELSWLWASDKPFREKFSRQQGWELPAT